MKIIGIVSEYNPFHAGHRYHLRETARLHPDGILVAVMSGYFVQRGEFSVLSKWERAKVAVQNGADLVIELPTFFATSAAPDFAEGAMRLLKKIGATHFSFGSEIGSLEEVKRLSEYTESTHYQDKLKDALSKGYSYATASVLAGGSVLPNAMLASEYLKHSGELIPVLIPRATNHSKETLYTRASHAVTFDSALCTGSPDDALRAATSVSDTAAANVPPIFSSAKAIRKALAAERENPLGMIPSNVPNCIPSDTPKRRLTELSGVAYHDCLSPVFGTTHRERADSLLLYLIRSLSANQLRQFRGVTEGFENRLKQAALYANGMADLIASSRTRRFPDAKIGRILLSILLDIKKEDLPAYKSEEALSYLRVLSGNEKGRRVLSEIQSKIRDRRQEGAERNGEKCKDTGRESSGRNGFGIGNTEIISKLSKSKNNSPLIRLDQRAASLYASVTKQPDTEHSELPRFLP